MHRYHPRTRLGAFSFSVLSSALVIHSSARRSGVTEDVPLSSLTHDCSLGFCFAVFFLVNREKLKIELKVFSTKITGPVAGGCNHVIPNLSVIPPV
jgi:hypothetical protein